MWCAALSPPLQSDEMAGSSTVVRARIDQATKERAVHALQTMGLSVSDVIRMLLYRIAEEQRLPFEVKVPNAVTQEAMAQLEAGKGQRFDDVDSLMAELDAED